MGPLTLGEIKEKLAPHHPERRLAVLEQLWHAFGLRWAFIETVASNAFTATVVAETGIGTLKETGGMLSLQMTLFREFTGTGVKERSDSSQLQLFIGEKELHFAWPGALQEMLADPTFQWIVQQVQG
jgi:hypothetical protein